MKKATYWLKEMSWREFDHFRKQSDLVIIPGGATEVYGPHLPLGSDTLVSQAISERVAQRVNAVIAPMLEAGESKSLSAFPGTVVIRPLSYEAVYRDIIESMIRWGFKKFLFLDMHAGNVPIISQLATEYQMSHGIRCAQVDWWRFVQSHSEEILDRTGRAAHGHASECGTSVMMYLYPELVDFSFADSVYPDESFYRYPDVLTYPSLEEKTKNGIVGDATCATPEKGKAIVERCVERIVQFVQEYF